MQVVENSRERGEIFFYNALFSSIYKNKTFFGSFWKLGQLSNRRIRLALIATGGSD
jgi:hypothetical protein